MLPWMLLASSFGVVPGLNELPYVVGPLRRRRPDARHTEVACPRCGAPVGVECDPRTLGKWRAHLARVSVPPTAGETGEAPVPSPGAVAPCSAPASRRTPGDAGERGEGMDPRSAGTESGEVATGPAPATPAGDDVGGA